MKYLIPILFGIIIILLFYFSKNNKEENYTTTNSNQEIILRAIMPSYLDISGLDISGAQFKTLKTNNLNALNLSKIIVAWSGSIETIPEGWIICDGTNGTPDLRDRFIIGATPSSVRTLSNGLTPKKVSDASGSELEKLLENQTPFHNHSLDWTNLGCTGGLCGLTGDWVGITFGTANKLVSTSYLGPMALPNFTGNNITSESTGHDNMPPYYTLAYIMKT
jgi:microcystin-dependent protein